MAGNVAARSTSSTVQDYLKTLLRIEESQDRVSTSNVARTLAVADSTVTDMLRKLHRAGLLEYRPYYGATLTEKGRKAALGILRRHRLIELFLHDVLGYGWEEVHEEAEKLEHTVSDFFIERVDALLKHPARDPHGEVIPDREGGREPEEGICLGGAAEGRYQIVRVTNGEPGFFAYLERAGLRPGTRLTLVKREPYGGPLKLRVEGRKGLVYLGVEAVANIFVKPQKPA